MSFSLDPTSSKKIHGGRGKGLVVCDPQVVGTIQR